MRIMFNSGYLNKIEFANNLLVRDLAEKLFEHGHDVYIVGTDVDVDSIIKIDKIKYKEIKIPEYCKLLNIARFEAKKSNLDSFLKRLIFSFRHPILTFYIILFMFESSRKLLKRNYKKDIEEISCDLDIDIIVSVVYPFEKTEAIMNSKKISARKIYYQFDPYGKHQLFKNNFKRELKVFENCDYIVTTELLYQEYQSERECRRFLNKMCYLHFPTKTNISHIKYDKINFSQDYINILYIGTLDSKIRNIDKFVRFVKKNKQLRLYLVGSIDQTLKRKYQDIDNVFIMGYIDSKYMDFLIKKSDILLNVGNIVNNMLPSKVFKYLMSGKPIIHYQLIDNCSSLKYLNEYPESFIINTEVDEREIIDFLNRNKNSKPIIYPKSKEFELDYVASKLSDIMVAIKERKSDGEEL